MLQRNAMIGALAVTSFVLVVIGGVSARAVEAFAAPAPAATAAADPLSDPSTRQIILQREAKYRQLLEQANAQLQQAYQQLAQAAPAGGANITSAPEPATSGYPVSPKMAAAIALNAAPGTSLIGWPELVNYQGNAAYEVKLSSGLLYVDATSGSVLYNGAVQRPSAPAGEYEGGEHESEGGDD